MTGILSELAGGFASVLDPWTLAYCFAGVALGTFVGALPGLGAMLGISLLLPVTYYLTPEQAIIMLAGIYYGGEYGGSIAAILINVPGTPSSAVATLDGHAMARRGDAALALFASALASFGAGLVGIVLLMFFSPLIAAFALAFTSVEYFAVMLLGLAGAASIARGTRAKALAATVLGVLLGTVGRDVSTGVARFTLDLPDLIGGVGLVALAMGLFGFAEVASATDRTVTDAGRGRIRMRDMLPDRHQWRASGAPFGRGAALGAVLGALPGTGPTIASFMAYAVEKRIARDPDRFGSGAIEGLVAPEAANNAAAQTAFIPTLTLGIPGTATMALILGALVIQGIQPGPTMLAENADLFWALVASFWIGNLFLLVLNVPLVGFWALLVRVPFRLLFPAVVCLIAVGVYSIDLNPFGIVVVIAVGLFGVFMRVADLAAAPFLMGFILGPAMEENLRRSMLLARGDVGVFFASPVAATCLAITGAVLLGPVLLRAMRSRVRS